MATASASGAPERLPRTHLTPISPAHNMLHNSEHRIPDPNQLGQLGAPPERPNMVFLAKSKKTTNSDARLGPALASPSTLNTLFHTLNYAAFAIAIAADNNVPGHPRPRAV